MDKLFWSIYHATRFMVWILHNMADRIGFASAPKGGRDEKPEFKDSSLFDDLYPGDCRLFQG